MNELHNQEERSERSAPRRDLAGNATLEENDDDC